MRLSLTLAVVTCLAGLSRAEPPSASYPGAYAGSQGQGYGSGYPSQGQDTPIFSHMQDFQQGDGVIWGEWSVLLPDGRTQKVRYDADETGFHPTVTFEEPGGAEGYGTGEGNGGRGRGGGHNY